MISLTGMQKAVNELQRKLDPIPEILVFLSEDEIPDNLPPGGPPIIILDERRTEND